jgi:hypothetical protein
MTILLALLFPLAIQYERKGWWYLVLPVTLSAFVVDVIANYTELAFLLWDFPRQGEYTFSQRLHRLQYANGLRGLISRKIVLTLNYISPSGQHIKP